MLKYSIHFINEWSLHAKTNQYLFRNSSHLAQVECLRDNAKRLTKINVNLNKLQQGKYYVCLTYEQRDYDAYTTKLYVFEGRVLADSGYDDIEE